MSALRSLSRSVAKAQGTFESRRQRLERLAREKAAKEAAEKAKTEKK